MRKAAILDVLELPAELFARGPVTGALERGRAEELAYAGDPRERRVEGVAEQSEHAGGAQDPPDLGERCAPVKPVKGRPYGDRIDAVVRERQPLRRARQRVGRGQRVGEDRAHLLQRLDGDDAVAGVEQRAGQLAGARAEVEHVERLRPEQPCDRLARIARAPALVLAGHLGEGACAPCPVGDVHVELCAHP